MKRHLLPAILAGTLALSGAAFAASMTTTEGIVKSIDMSAHTLTLSDGSVYKLPANFKNADVKAGAKVNVTWEMMGVSKEASDVSIAKS